MKNIFSGEDKVGEIVAKCPKASEVFQKYQIDFCCGGDRSLRVVLQEQNLNEERVLSALTEAHNKVMSLQDKGIDWQMAPFSDLIDHVISTHHTYLVRELPKLSDLTTKIYRVHGVDHGKVLSKVHKLFHSLKMELDQHLIKEEEILFPLIKAYEAQPSNELLVKAINVIDELESEHEGAGDILKELRHITDQYQVPSGGCHSYELTFKGLEMLESDLFQHIHLENNILFPRLEALKK
ncbi:protein of unknown function DUF542, ScdA domain protein [Alkaliphilus metalliredigens QYMF]|uniref:Hemerythrin-like domain-containing protein n=1 Tax=Alkaliphilus metalliredigens (strain QYMF) TaxID=293826 RepID=A6TWA7_ALKMQ|nr:iron-sulfur cluster repair di-iron protein [Alkaliphilus metalliredigens]ABR50475.1 protein of unknown function DUF542, ScdA domain protein [Alkaliphilus metalliredigens QYMF]